MAELRDQSKRGVTRSVTPTPGMIRTLAWVGIVALLALSACSRELKYDPVAGSHLRTDTSMVMHEDQSNKSSTSVGIGMD
jgi:hypothetical protein